MHITENLCNFAQYFINCAIGMVTKTRDKLIEVARQLFAHKGMENTTMNDIAAASDKGRRTIYTYFKNKRDIYNAVVERESDQLTGTLVEITRSDRLPVDKLRDFLTARFDLFTDAFQRRDSFRNFFGRDFKRIERIHKLVVAREQQLLRSILDQGVEAGVFDSAAALLLPAAETMTFQGVDYAHFRDTFAVSGFSAPECRQRLVEYFVSTITISPKSKPQFT